jgi:hypothetical protein
LLRTTVLTLLILLHIINYLTIKLVESINLLFYRRAIIRTLSFNNKHDLKALFLRIKTNPTNAFINSINKLTLIIV